MKMATCFAPLSISVGSQLKTRELFLSTNSNSFGKTSKLTVHTKTNRKFSLRSDYRLYARLNPFFSIVHTSTTCLFSYFFLSFCIAHCIHSSDANSGGGGDFVAGFLLGGAVFGTLAYIFAPQIRRSLLNEDEYGFRKARKPIYYDEGLEKTRQTLNEKIGQLNSAIDKVSTRLRGGNNSTKVPVESDPEVEATI
ncbi:hypothetical protein FEM48_Zijuj03G0201500 [Ziziphus jujuba var. spinosa]|uniref:Uncharacterized protein n=1 Tax=Ziziphus jujuba var. spinosa TaxID=714518 RepID=A0A978VSD4_ZIZJJ|nr:hypothetical protein FEM48_Zijuj03G0201500 [Ziziphus jujuba var. spinosa]